MTELIYKDEAYAIVGACFEVFNELGVGFQELVYQECLCIEFGLRGIPFASKKKLTIVYKGHTLEKTFEPDFVCYDKIVVEIKAESDLCDAHRAQLHNYLKATGFKLGLLINFGKFPKLQYERIVR